MKPNVPILALALFTGPAFAGGKDSGLVDARGAAEASNRFALALYPRLAKEGAGGNVFFSPLSLSQALAMTMTGAAGATREEMAKVLGLEAMTVEEVDRAQADLRGILDPKDPKVSLSVANALWPDQRLRLLDAFLEITEEFRQIANQFKESDSHVPVN